MFCFTSYNHAKLSSSSNGLKFQSNSPKHGSAGNVVYAQEFARRYRGKILSFPIHPGPESAHIEPRMR